MRLPLLIAWVIAGSIAWMSWPRAKPPEPVIAPAAQPTPTPVPFLVKAKVKAIMAEQRKIFVGGSRADIEAAQTKIRIFAQDIRERLASDGIYDEGAVQGVIRRPPRRTGLGPQQASTSPQPRKTFRSGRRHGQRGPRGIRDCRPSAGGVICRLERAPNNAHVRPAAARGKSPIIPEAWEIRGNGTPLRDAPHRHAKVPRRICAGIHRVRPVVCIG